MIAVIAAMEREADAVRASLPRCAVLHVSGVGKVNAAVAAMSALWLSVDAVVNVGLAGAVGNGAEVGDAFTVSKSVQYDVDLSAVDATEVGTPDGRRTPFYALRAVPGFRSARCGTADRFGHGTADDAILRRFGCVLRDMECAAIAQVCERVGKPFCSVKVVSDLGRFPKPTAEQYRENMDLCLSRLAEAAKKAVEWAASEASEKI